MKRYVTLFFLFAINNTVHCQEQPATILSYHLLINSAEKFIIAGTYDSAIYEYQRAFAQNKPFAADIYNAFLAASIDKNLKAAEKFIWLLAEKGIGSNFLAKNSNFKSYRTNSNWNDWLKKADKEKAQLEINNQEFITRIEKISFTAENLYRVWIQTLKGETRSVESDFEKQLDEQNNYLIDSLLSVIAQFGYPSEGRIGVNILNDTVISTEPIFTKIILRGYSKPNGIGGNTFDEILKKALDSGFIRPFFFAKMHDNKHFQNDSPYGTTFFSGLHGKIYYRLGEAMNIINKNRKEIGLPSLLEYGKLIEFANNHTSSFSLSYSFTTQDLFATTQDQIRDFLKDHKIFDPENFSRD